MNEMEYRKYTTWIYSYLDAMGYRITQHEHYINVYNGTELILTYNRATGDVEMNVKEIPFIVLKALMEVVG